MFKSVSDKLLLFFVLICMCIWGNAYAHDAPARSKPRDFIKITPSDNDSVGDKDLKYILVSLASTANLGRIAVNEEVASRSDAVLTDGTRIVRLRAVPTRYDSSICLLLEDGLAEGEWRLEIPEDYFYIDVPVSEVSAVSGAPEYYAQLPETGAWHKTGDSWRRAPRFNT